YRDQRAARMQQKHGAYERDDDALLDQRLPQSGDGPQDQFRAVVDWFYRDPFREARQQFGDARLHVADRGQCIGAVAFDDDPADRLAGPVELADTAALIGAKLDPRDIAHQDRSAFSGLRLQHHPREIVGATEIA